MNKPILILGIFFMSLVFTGCGTLLNPFHENFDCQADGRGGQCADTDTVYKDLKVPAVKTTGSQTISSSQHNKVLDIPIQKVPLLKQPEVIRILILPYVSDGRLNMARYVYMADKEPKWNIK